MKKTVLLSMIASMTLLSAGDFEYQKSYPTKYLVGISGFLQANNAETNTGINDDGNWGFGIELNTYQTYDFTKRFFVGIKGGVNYTFGAGYLDTDSWGIYAEPRVGFKVTQKLNIFAGVGYQYDSFSEYEYNNYYWVTIPEKSLEYSLDGGYLSIGLDYIMSEDLVLGIKYSRGFGLNVDAEQNIGDLYRPDITADQNKIRFEVTIPFT